MAAAVHLAQLVTLDRLERVVHVPFRYVVHQDLQVAYAGFYLVVLHENEWPYLRFASKREIWTLNLEFTKKEA